MVQGDGLVVPLIKSDRNPFFGVVAVGRGESCDIQLSSQEVSKHHALFRASPDGWLIQDASSRNGTFVNHLRLTPKHDHRVNPGDQVRFADVLAESYTQRGKPAFASAATHFVQKRGHDTSTTAAKRMT